jgi:hypothetical protein
MSASNWFQDSCDRSLMKTDRCPVIVAASTAGDVVLLLAEQLPKVVSNQVSQLRPYLGCAKAHCVRGALMAATGSILVQVRLKCCVMFTHPVSI